MLLATPRRRRAVYISCTALIATVSIFAFAQNTTTALPQRARLVLPVGAAVGQHVIGGDAADARRRRHARGTLPRAGFEGEPQGRARAERDRRRRRLPATAGAAAGAPRSSLGRQHANRARRVQALLEASGLEKAGHFFGLGDAPHFAARDDAFAQYVSICLAQASNVWAAYPGSAKHDHVVSVDAALFDTWSKHEAAFVETVERALAKAANPPGVLHLTYERDLCVPHARRNTMRRVERFLGVAADRARADAEHLPVKQHKVDVRDPCRTESTSRVSSAGRPRLGPASRRDGADVRRDVAGVDRLGSGRRPRIRGPRPTPRRPRSRGRPTARRGAAVVARLRVI